MRILSALIALLLVPESAWAWGPVTHLWYGAQATADLHNLPAALQQLLTAHHASYLYGTIAADIVQVKRYTRSIYTHCHSWHVGWQVLEAAETDSQRAFGWGYLSHLAADVCSHNVFVPGRLVASYESSLRRHVYWEARFESDFGPEDRDRLGRVLATKDPSCEALVERVVERTLFSFRTNKTIFAAVVALQQLDQWQATMQRLASQSPFTLPTDLVARLRGLAVAATRDLLQHGTQAAIVRHDPNGHETIRKAKEIRRKLRALRRRGESVEVLARQLKKAFSTL